MSSRPPPRHSFEEHTSELAVRVSAPSLSELFAEAGRALAEAMGSRIGEAADGEPLHVELSADDRDALLFDWLNEIIFRAETERVVYTDFSFDKIDDQRLEATIRGIRVPELRTVVKAATFSGLHIRETPDGFEVSVVFDV